MKRFILAAASLTASIAFAQAPAPAAPVVDQPKHKCVDPGEFPGRLGMSQESTRKRFMKDIENYKTCMMNFVEERKAVIKANEVAARTAIEDYNAKIKHYSEEQEKLQ
jgi:hypothetical protein